LDRVPTEDVLRFEQEFIDHVRRSQKDVLESIADTLKFEDETEDKLAKAYDDFLDQFETSEGGSIKAGHEEHEALEDEDIDQEKIVKQKKA
jgi:F-type H+-transporting ATPase subunit alpha